MKMAGVGSVRACARVCLCCPIGQQAIGSNIQKIGSA